MVISSNNKAFNFVCTYYIIYKSIRIIFDKSNNKFNFPNVNEMYGFDRHFESLQLLY